MANPNTEIVPLGAEKFVDPEAVLLKPEVIRW